MQNSFVDFLRGKQAEDEEDEADDEDFSFFHPFQAFRDIHVMVPRSSQKISISHVTSY